MSQHPRRDNEFLQHITGLSSKFNTILLSQILLLRWTYYLIFNGSLSLSREEIQRIKAGNPDISHREAFSTAAKNVSHGLITKKRRHHVSQLFHIWEVL